uniref:Integrase, catalytic region, zinc finger, CCHC-type, peptidase aspartic, catalytic n=1 Tax=Tanacetum cinerariifolium TaxID=118510 RepID=A0A6L2M8Z1_TANCI|nr:integrase, catalytic region, zinc finger, CCHC-type, peptidase aspartic, catalytic [Tanacetum cinerariifolium]
MASLTFADTHNMVAYLSKSAASVVIDQIVDFLNAQVIQYALRVNPTIYVFCIKQFWATASIKKANNVVKLQALIDGKNVVVTQDVIRQDLHLNDANGVECRKFNLSKYIFDSMVRNVDIPSKFLMGKIEAIDANEDITLVDVKTQKEVADMDAELQGRITQEDVSAATKDANAVEPTVFDDEEVTMSMAQTLIKMKAKKARLLDEQIAKRKYQSLKRKPVSIAQARKNMIIYLKNMVGYKMEHFIVKDKFSSAVPNVDKEKSLWVKLKRLFKPDTDDVLWKLQRYMHYPITWKLYSNYGVHQVSSIKRRHEMFILTEKNYPLSNGVMTLMLSEKLQVKEDSDMAKDLVMKIFMEANKPKSRSLDTSSNKNCRHVDDVVILAPSYDLVAIHGILVPRWLDLCMMDGVNIPENVIVGGPDNRLPMLEKTRYSSWESRMLLYIKRKEHGKLICDSVINGPFKYGKITVPRTQTTHATIRDRTYDELIDAEKIRKDRVKLLIEGSDLLLQERESKLYDEFDTFTSVLGETIHSYYLRFVMDVKLAKDLHNTNFDHLYGYLRQHEAHANKVRQLRQRCPNPLTLNCQEEGHMARHCNKPKRPRNLAWFKEKMLHAEALESGVSLDEEHRAFLADNKDTFTRDQASQELVTIAAFQTDDLDAFDSDFDVLKKESKAKEDKYLKKIIDLEKIKKALDNVVYKMGQSTKTMHMLTKPQVFYNEAHKTALDYQNPLYLTQAQRKFPALYYGNTIVKQHGALSVIDTEETLELAKEKAKNNSISKLKDHIATLKGKSMSESDKSENISKVIAPRMYKLDLEPLSPILLKNREAHIDYLKHTQENVDTVCEIVEQARALRPLDIDLDCAYLCGLMIIETINGKKHIWVIVDDYSRFTWVKFLRSKDETPEFEIKFLKMIQSVVSPVPVVAAPRHVDPTDTPLSTSIEQDAPAASTSSTIQVTQSPVISKGVEEQLQPTHFDNDPFLDVLTSEPSSQESSSIMQPANQPFEHINKWIKIHPLENVIGNPSRPIST